MVALGTAQAPKQWAQGAAVVASQYLIKGLNSGDTLDLSGDYRRIIHAAFSPATDAVVLSLPTVNGTTLTFAQVGMVNVAGYLFVTGIPQ